MQVLVIFIDGYLGSQFGQNTNEKLASMLITAYSNNFDRISGESTVKFGKIKKF
jgi:hypothetical protein